MDYRETLDFLYSQLPMFQRIGAAAYKHDLSNTIRLCEIIGNPQNRFRSVHIAGTNGKGSCAHLLASILQESGYKTGLFTSPHLADFRERIRIDGNRIGEDRVTAFVAKYRKAADDIKPSFFEYTAAMAFWYFEEEKVDVAVLETGMGGRLDSTNVVKPDISVITNISRDHMRFLGDTIEKITTEKAGIIKKGVPVIIGETQPETEKIFRETAAAKGSSIYFADRHYLVTNPSNTDERHEGTEKLNVLRNGEEFLAGMRNPLLGNYQRKNIQTVLMTAEVMKDNGYRIGTESLKSGILNVMRNTRLAGRWQVLDTRPLTICDVGHNEAGIQYLVRQILKTPHQQLHFVLGAVNDKDIKKILQLLPKDATYYFCKADIPRGLDAEILAKAAGKEDLKGDVYSSVRDAYISAVKNAADDDMIFIGGSTFVVAEVLWLVNPR